MRYKVKYLFNKQCPVFVVGPDNDAMIRDLFNETDYYYFDHSACILPINAKVLFLTVYYYFRLYSLKSAYLTALIHSLSPDLVLTVIDNSIYYFRAARMLHERSRFIAIQNGVRFDVWSRPKAWTDEIFIPEFACFGQNDKDIYTRLKAKVGKYHLIGSMNELFFKAHTNVYSELTKGSEPDYDLCIISEDFSVEDEDTPGIHNAVGMIAAFAQRYAKENDLKVVIAFKQKEHVKNRLGMTESDVYSEFVDFNDVESVFRDRDDAKWTSYETTCRSRVTLGIVSTLLLEAASRGSRVLICDFFGAPWTLGAEAPLALSNTELSYEKFSNALTQLMSESDEEYMAKRKQQIDYLMRDQGVRSPTEVLSKIISMPEILSVP